MGQEQQSLGATVQWWVLYLVGWVGTSALALWLTLQLRINLIDLNNFLGWGPWLLIAVDKFGWVLLGLGWLIGVFGIDIYLRGAPTRRQLLRRLWRVLWLVSAGLGVSYGLQWLLI